MYYQPTNRPHDVMSNQEFVSPKDRVHSPLVAYATGGSTLYDGNNLTGYIWKAFVHNDGVYIQREDSTESSLLFTQENISQIDLTFDQVMRPFVCFMVKDSSYYWHFDKDSGEVKAIQLPKGCKFPRCELDQRVNVPNSDIILAYMRESNLCIRIQREYFAQEHIIKTNPNKTILYRIGLLNGGRFGYQWG